MKKTTKIKRDNKAIQGNIDWLRIKTKYFKKRAFCLLKNGKKAESFVISSPFPNRYSVNRYLKRIGINQQVTKKVSAGLKATRLI